MEYILTTHVDVDDAINEWSMNSQQEHYLWKAETARFLREKGLKPKAIAKLLGLNGADARHLIRIGKIDPDVRMLIKDKGISLGHSRVIAGYPREDQDRITRDILQYGMSVRQAEKARKEGIADSKPDADYYRHLGAFISEQIGHPTTVRQQGSTKSGVIEIQYVDFEGFDSIMDRLNVDLQDL